MSGLSINKNKSTVFLSKSCTQKALIQAVLGIKAGSFPIRYLGIPLVDSKLKHQHYARLIKQVKERLARWKYKLLSFTGRVELIKSVIFSFLHFWIAAFSLPAGTRAKLNSIISSFLWQGGVHTISWHSICQPKENGGLGIRSIDTIYEAATAKRIWTLLSSKNFLWAWWMNKKILEGNP